MKGCWLSAGVIALASVQAGPILAQPAAPQVDPAAFVVHLQRVTYRQALRGLQVDPAVIDSLAAGDFAQAVTALSQPAAADSSPATVALVRLQHACARLLQTRPTDPAEVERLRAELGDSRTTRLMATVNEQNAFVQRAAASCRSARFDLRQIEGRLRAAAEAGDPVSATELARFTGDTARREALLVAAAAKKHPPAQHALAQSRVVGVQRGLSTENVASIRELLKQAGQSLPIAKLDFANCVAVGCDGHPADAATAAVFGIDAARDGESAAFPAIVRMPWRQRLKPEEILAWQYFGDRLNESGCSGEGYVGASLGFARTLAQLEQAMRPDTVAAGRQLAGRYWMEHGERAVREQLCGQ